MNDSMCIVECTLLSEIAKAVATEILDNIQKKPGPGIIGLNVDTYEVVFDPDESKIICEDGWTPI